MMMSVMKIDWQQRDNTTTTMTSDDRQQRNGCGNDEMMAWQGWHGYWWLQQWLGDTWISDQLHDNNDWWQKRNSKWCNRSDKDGNGVMWLQQWLNAWWLWQQWQGVGNTRKERATVFNRGYCINQQSTQWQQWRQRQHWQHCWASGVSGCSNQKQQWRQHQHQ